MFKILLATDGSGYALQAADFAADLRRLLGQAEITVIHVIEPPPMVAMSSPEGMEVPVAWPQPEEMDKISRKMLEATQDRLKAKGQEGILRSARGRAVEVICDTAAKENFDLIVMGSRGMGHVVGIFLGSVSDKVLHRATTPVLIVRRSEPRAR